MIETLPVRIIIEFERGVKEFAEFGDFLILNLSRSEPGDTEISSYAQNEIKLKKLI